MSGLPGLFCWPQVELGSSYKSWKNESKSQSKSKSWCCRYMQKYMQILKVICFFSPAEKCECKELALTSSKLFCTMNYAYGECVWILRTQSLPKTWFKFNAAWCIFSLLPPNPTVLKVKVLSAHDKGSHAEVEVKVQKVLSQNTKVKIQRGRVTLYPESWTARGCTCPILNPGQSSVPTWFMSKEIILKYCFDSQWVSSLDFWIWL